MAGLSETACSGRANENSGDTHEETSVIQRTITTVAATGEPPSLFAWLNDRSSLIINI